MLKSCLKCGCGAILILNVILFYIRYNMMIPIELFLYSKPYSKRLLSVLETFICFLQIFSQPDFLS